MASLDPKSLSTSSSKYECELAEELSSRVDRVCVMSFRAKECEIDGNVRLIPCATSDQLRDFSGLCEQIDANLKDGSGKSVILFFGYNPKLIDALVRFKDRAKIASVIYDTHKGALEGKSFVRKLAIDRFFSSGLRRVNTLDGVILFREAAAMALGLKIPHCVILPAADSDDVSPYRDTANRKLRFLYAGTLCGYNATKELVDAFAEYDGDAAELYLFGDGPLSGYVAEAARSTDRIRYFGRVATERIEAETSDSDVLVNLRDMRSEVNKFAFPSKLVEYMKCGKAVMSTRVSEAAEFADAVFMCADTSVEAILSCLKYICAHREELPEKVKKAGVYLKKYHDSESNFGRLYDFLFNELN